MFLNLVSRPLIYISYIVFKNCNGLYSTFENVCYETYETSSYKNAQV